MATAFRAKNSGARVPLAGDLDLLPNAGRHVPRQLKSVVVWTEAKGKT